MLSPASDFIHPVERPDGTSVLFAGWHNIEEPQGWRYSIPNAILCRSCHERDTQSLLEVTGAYAVGGRYSLIWATECPACGLRVFFPATDLGPETGKDA